MPTHAVSVVIEDDLLLELDQYFFVELSGERVIIRCKCGAGDYNG